RHHLLELPTAGATQDATAQPCLEYMQLCFAHRALQAQKQAGVEVRRVIQPVLIKDEGVGESTEFEQSRPVGGVARQARYLKAKYDPDVSQADFGHQPLKTFTIGSARCGLPQIAVNHYDTIQRPTQGNCTFA